MIYVIPLHLDHSINPPASDDAARWKMLINHLVSGYAKIPQVARLQSKTQRLRPLIDVGVGKHRPMLFSALSKQAPEITVRPFDSSRSCIVGMLLLTLILRRWLQKPSLIVTARTGMLRSFA